MKELKQCRNIQDLEVNLDVKSKAKSFIETYMLKFDKEYKPDPSEKTKNPKTKHKKDKGKILTKQVESTETSAGEESSLMMPDSSISPSNLTKVPDGNDSNSNTRSEEINESVESSGDENDIEDNDKSSSARGVNSPSFNIEEVSVNG